MKAKRISEHIHYNLTAGQEVLPIQFSFSNSYYLERVPPSYFSSTWTKVGCSTALCPCSSPTNCSNMQIVQSFLIWAETQSLTLNTT